MPLIIDLYKRHLVRIVLSLIILALFLVHVSGLFTLSVLDATEQFAYDQRLRWTTANSIDDRIVIIDIDESSLAVEGRWPWSRDRLAHLVDQLFDNYGVAMVGFDVVFPEHDESSGLKILQELASTDFSDDPRFKSKVRELEPSLNYDRIFADSLQDRMIVLGYYFNDDADQTAGTIPEPIF